MANKIKIIGIITISLSIGLIPTGFLLNKYLNDEVTQGVAEALLEIKKEMIPEIEYMVNYSAIPEVLLGIKDDFLPEIENLINYSAIPEVLLGLRETALPFIEEMVNATFVATLINMTQSGLTTPIVVPPVNPITFFNDSTYQFNAILIVFDGVSTHFGIPINYSLDAADRLLYGHSYIGSDFPGLLTDLDLGSGVLEWLGLFDLASVDIGNRTLMTFVYNATWEQLTYLEEYIRDYMILDIVPDAALWAFLFDPKYTGLQTTDAIAEATFYEQWANGTIMIEGFDLGEIVGLEEELKGFEAGIPNPINLSREISMDLWDTMNSSAFVNISLGFPKWMVAATGNLTIQNELTALFNLTDSQLSILMNWLFKTFKENLVWPLFEYNQGITVPEYAEVLFCEQWANGTILKEALYPGGIDLGEELGLGFSLKGFEVGVPNPTNISLISSKELWDPMNPSAIVNYEKGFPKWMVAAAGNLTIQSDLITTFNLTSMQLATLLDWLFTTIKEDIVPPLFEFERGMTIPEYAEVLFYEQWANGTFRGDVLYPGGIDLGEELGLGFSLKGFEVGIPTPTDISLTTARTLYDEGSTAALVNAKGLQKWFDVSSNNSTDTYNKLKSALDLTDEQMVAITGWLLRFRNKIVPILAQHEMGLPTDPLTLSNIFTYGLTIPGVCLLVAGLILLSKVERKVKV